MNRLEYLAHNGDPEDIIKEVMEALNEKDEQIKEIEKERDDLEIKIEQYRSLLNGFAIEIQQELRRLR